MENIDMIFDLSNQNLQKQIDIFHGLKSKPFFCIAEDIDVHILFFKRKDKYYGIRTVEKADYSSGSEFLVNSFMIEELRAHVTKNLVLRNLKAENFPIHELSSLFSRAKKIGEHLPNIGDIQSCHIIENSSDLNWVFLEEKSKYHSLFWSASESKLFRRCA